MVLRLGDELWVDQLWRWFHICIWVAYWSSYGLGDFVVLDFHDFVKYLSRSDSLDSRFCSACNLTYTHRLIRSLLLSFHFWISFYSSVVMGIRLTFGVLVHTVLYDELLVVDSLIDQFPLFVTLGDLESHRSNDYLSHLSSMCLTIHRLLSFSILFMNRWNELRHDEFERHGEEVLVEQRLSFHDWSQVTTTSCFFTF